MDIRLSSALSNKFHVFCGSGFTIIGLVGSLFVGVSDFLSLQPVSINDTPTKTNAGIN
jgi:hypothetical protein